MSATIDKDMKYDGIEIFSATMHKERDALGLRVTKFIGELRANGGDVRSTSVFQSSDEQFHCVTIVLTYVKSVRNGVRITERAA